MSNMIEKFPDDILDIIVRLCDTPSLASLVRVCKHLHRLALPLLYKHVNLHDCDPIEGIKYLRPLTFMLLQKPEVAGMVHAITIRQQYRIDTTWTAEDEVPWKPWPDHPDLDSILKSAILAQTGEQKASVAAVKPRMTRSKAREQETKEHDSKDPDQWFRLVREGFHEAAILAMLLPNLVNLRSMDVPFDDEWGGWGRDDGPSSHLIEEVLERAAMKSIQIQGKPMFGCLTDVLIPGVSDKYPDNPLFLGSCACMPAVKRLYGFNQGNEDDVDDEEITPSFKRLEDGVSPIELIHLRNSKLNSGNFSKLMKCPKSLKTLIYEMGNTWAWVRIEFSQTQLALNQQAHSLERLWLSYYDYFLFMDTDETTPMTFNHFTSLRNLRIAPVYIFGNDLLELEDGNGEQGSGAPKLTKKEISRTKDTLKDALPSQLETLDLVYCNDAALLYRLVACLAELLQVKNEQFRSLSGVSIHGQNEENLKSHLKALKALPWKDNGVHMVVQHETDRDGSSDNGPLPWGWDGDVEWAECINDMKGPTKTLWNGRDNH